MEDYDVVIVGGGPSGLFTALNIDPRKKVVLLEKNDIPGKKLLAAGAGRCNISHIGNSQDFIRRYGENGKFLKSSLKEFFNVDLINFLKKSGMEIIIDKNGKIFPSTENSRDVLDLLLRECKKKGVEIRCKENVLNITDIPGKFLINTKEKIYKANKLVVATGGKSYPALGSSGDGYEFAKFVGHTIIPTKVSLAPVYIREYRFGKISGVSMSNMEMSLWRNNKKTRIFRGDIGFTHTGLSGPGILDNSRYMIPGDIIEMNIVNCKHDEFREVFMKFSQIEGKMLVKQFIKQFLGQLKIPDSLLKIILEEIEINNKHLAEISKKSRNQLIKNLCGYELVIDKIGDYNNAMATAGGISLKEISQKTMESKLVKGLYFIGEVLDIDGDTGGYNIQAAFSTGYMAAKAINER